MRAKFFTVLAAFLFGSSAVQAQNSRQTVKIVVPYGAGGFIDSLARAYTQIMADDLGQTWILENKVGAGGKIGEDFAAAAASDGNTLLISLVLRPTLARVTSPEAKERDQLSDFEVIGALASTPLLMSAATNLGVKTFPELVAKIKAEPGKHSYGSTGMGTPSQIAAAMLVKKLGLDIAHVPYRGGAPALPDLTSGVIAWLIDTPTGSGALVESGNVVPMFITDRQRHKAYPQVPTLLELGHPEFSDMISTVFLMAPTGTPPSLLDRYHAALLRAQNNEVAQRLLANLRLAPPESNMSRTEATKAAKAQIEVWQRTIAELERP